MRSTADLVTTSDAAQILGVNVATVNRWAADGTLRVAHKLPGRRGANLYRRSAVERLAAKRAADNEPAA